MFVKPETLRDPEAPCISLQPRRILLEATPETHGAIESTLLRADNMHFYLCTQGSVTVTCKHVPSYTGPSIQGFVYLLGEMGPHVLRMFFREDGSDPLCRESPDLFTEPTQEIGRLRSEPTPTLTSEPSESPEDHLKWTLGPCDESCGNVQPLLTARGTKLGG